jgi:hypothetical protein
MQLLGLIIAAVAATAAVFVGVLGWRRRQTVLTVVAALLLPLAIAVAAVSLILPVVADGLLGASEAAPITCQAATNFIDQSALPAGAGETSCTRGGFQDAIYTIDLVAEQPSLEQWLAGLPGRPSLTTHGCPAEAELCIQQVAFVPRAEGGADFFELTAKHRPDGKLSVHAVAINT